jgi:predicted HicB family RNase H-like nuclease
MAIGADLLMSDEIHKTTEGITLRIPSSSIRQLREESKKKQVSLNTLVNQIIREHLD